MNEYLEMEVLLGTTDATLLSYCATRQLQDELLGVRAVCIWLRAWIHVVCALFPVPVCVSVCAEGGGGHVYVSLKSGVSWTQCFVWAGRF